MPKEIWNIIDHCFHKDERGSGHNIERAGNNRQRDLANESSKINDTACRDNKMNITREFLREFGVIMIFCDQYQCKIKTNNNKRFSFD